MEKQWKLLRKEEPIDLKLFRARFDWYLNLRTGKEVKMVAIDAEDSVNVMAFTPDKKLLMVKQYRFGVETHTIELPGGIIDEGESPLDAAKRELLEETGFSGGSWKYVAYNQSNPVFMNSLVHQFIASGVKRTGELKLDEGENIEVLEMDIEEIKDAYKRGLIRHPHTLTALTRVFDLEEKINPF